MTEAAGTVELRDGRSAVLRPVQPADREAIAAAVQRMSPESRYRRFFGAIRELSARELTYLTEVDHHDHEAIGAFEPESGLGLGVARFVRLDDDPSRAEAAVAVVDDWHGVGLGRALLEALAVRARREGIERFVALVQAENGPALHMLSSLGPTTRSMQQGVVELDIDLERGVEGLGGQLAAMLRAAAVGLYGTEPLAERLRSRVLKRG